MIKLKKLKNEQSAYGLLKKLYFHYQDKEYKFSAKNYTESAGAHILYAHRAFMIKDLKESEWYSALHPSKLHVLEIRKPIISEIFNKYNKIFNCYSSLNNFNVNEIKDIEKILKIINIHIKKSSNLENVRIALSHFPKNFDSYKTLNIIDKMVEKFDIIYYPQNNKTEDKIISLAIKNEDDFEQLREVVLMRKNELVEEAEKKNAQESKLKKKSVVLKENKPDNNLLLHKGKNNEYFYNNKKIDIQINTIYFKIFDIIYSFCNQDGFIPYENIENKLIELGMPAKDDPIMRNKRINNSISKTQGFFRYARINGNRLENKTLDSKKLLEIVRGKGIKLNNSKIK